MKLGQQHTDDWKKIFDTHQMPNLPINLEDNIMKTIEFQKLANTRQAPLWWTRNFVIFCASIFILTLIAVFQFMTNSTVSILSDFQIITFLSTVVFFILWLIETADSMLQNKFHNKLTSNFH